MAITVRYGFGTSPSPVTVVAHLFGVVAAVLMLVWVIHFHGALDLNSDNPDHIFNVHPVLMFIGFIFISGEAMMAYMTVGAERVTRKFVHMVLHLIALSLGILGIYAAFKFHDHAGIPDMYSLHSWFGMGTICLYGLQWVFGFLAFWFPRAPTQTRERARPWHVFGGLFLLFLAICSAETGLTERSVPLVHSTEGRLINFTGIFIFFFGVSVAFSVVLHQ